MHFVKNPDTTFGLYFVLHFCVLEYMKGSNQLLFFSFLFILSLTFRLALIICTLGK